MCLAVYTLAGGKVLRGFLVPTIADRLGISFEQAEEMADAAHAAGLVVHEYGTVALTGEGQACGATLTAPNLDRLAGASGEVARGSRMHAANYRAVTRTLEMRFLAAALVPNPQLLIVQCVGRLRPVCANELQNLW
jgi:hypothetical protein